MLHSEAASSACPTIVTWLGSVARESPCESCAFRAENFCGDLYAVDSGQSLHAGQQRVKSARQNISRAGEANPGLLMICEGWAVRYIQLRNGKRQILSVAMPGDLVSPTAAFEDECSYSIQAVTNVKYRYLSSGAVRVALNSNPDLRDKWIELVIGERQEADMLLEQLIQRSAEERIASFIVRLMARCAERGQLKGGAFECPLSQQQIADATGLTPVHVCRTLRLLRDANICEVGEGRIKVFAEDQLLQKACVY
jgi:CRP-like cAMP-binding protein